jgi:hypothetical protein
VEPIVNLEETPGKIVGRRKLPPGAALDPSISTIANAKQWQSAQMVARIPRGVYRFASHEEAYQWLWKMMTHPKS